MKRSRRLLLLIVLSLYGLGAVSAVDTWVRTFEGADYGAFFGITPVSYTHLRAHET